MKTAQRLAYFVMSMSDEEAQNFAEAIVHAHKSVHMCKICQNFTDKDICPICGSLKRDKSIICVVESPKDVAAFERTNEYNGVYHVLHGLISPIDKITPDKLKIKELLSRIDDSVSEVIMATNPTVEGEATAMYISRLLKPLGIKVTRLAFGLPVGGSLEFADEVTLFKALQNRNGDLNHENVRRILYAKALELAKKAYEIGEAPIGAVVVKKSTGEIVGEGYNRRETDKSPIAHAEILAISELLPVSADGGLLTVSFS